MHQMRFVWSRFFKNSSKVPVCFENVGKNYRAAATGRHMSTKKEGDSDAPIRYSTSQVAGWTARQSRVGKKEEDEFPWFQPYAITMSLAVFLIYFCILREENDIDEELGRSLYDRISGLEKKQLEISLQYNLDNNLETATIKERLKQIEEEEATQLNSEKHEAV